MVKGSLDDLFANDEVSHQLRIRVAVTVRGSAERFPWLKTDPLDCLGMRLPIRVHSVGGTSNVFFLAHEQKRVRAMATAYLGDVDLEERKKHLAPVRREPMHERIVRPAVGQLEIFPARV